MPMIDVYATAGTFPDPHQLATDLAIHSFIRWHREGVGAAVDERDVALTEAPPNLRVVSGSGARNARLQRLHQFIRE